MNPQNLNNQEPPPASQPTSNAEVPTELMAAEVKSGGVGGGTPITLTEPTPAEPPNKRLRTAFIVSLVLFGILPFIMGLSMLASDNGGLAFLGIFYALGGFCNIFIILAARIVYGLWHRQTRRAAREVTTGEKPAEYIMQKQVGFILVTGIVMLMIQVAADVLMVAHANGATDVSGDPWWRPLYFNMVLPGMTIIGVVLAVRSSRLLKQGARRLPTIVAAVLVLSPLWGQLKYAIPTYREALIPDYASVQTETDIYASEKSKTIIAEGLYYLEWLRDHE